jgi:hypothetical protein
MEFAAEWEFAEGWTFGPGIQVGLDGHDETQNFGAGFTVVYEF